MIISVIAALALKGPGELTLSYRPPLNKVYHYQLTLQTTRAMGKSPNQEMTARIPLDTKVIARKGDITTVQIKTGRAKVSVPPGSPISGMVRETEQGMGGQTAVTQLDSHLRPVNGFGSAVARVGQPMEVMRFPSRGVKVGSTWKFVLDMGAMSAAQKGSRVTGKLPVICKLEAIEGPNARISVSMNGSFKPGTGPSGSTAIHVSTKCVAVIEIATGATVSSQGVSDTSSTISGQRFVQHVVQSQTLKK